jgi:AraC-like DNA-binding protein
VRLALLAPDRDDTVGEIARRFGYRSLATFSRDFAQRYGQRPSDVLRMGKRSIMAASLCEV